MFQKTRLVTCIAVCVFFLMAIVFNVEAADKIYNWKCQTHFPISSASFKPSILTLVDNIEKNTNGALKIQVFAEGEFVPSKEIFPSLKRKVIQMGYLSTGYMREAVPLAQVASGLPFNHMNAWEAMYYYRMMGFEDMMRKEVAKHGIYYSSDKVYGTQLASKKPIRSMEDFKGLKLRSSGILQIYLSSIGAAASYLPGGELYSALGSGVIEGAHWGNILGNESMKLYELAKYHLDTPLNIAAVEAWVINQDALNELPENLQNIVKETLDQHFWSNTLDMLHRTAVHTPEFQKTYDVKITKLEGPEFTKMQESAQKIWDNVANSSPECKIAVDLLKQLNKEIRPVGPN